MAAPFLAMLLVATTVLLFDGSQASACSCAPPAPAGAAAEANEWVFIGRQIDKYEGQRTEDDGSWGEMRLVVEVLTVYKGDVPDTVELRTGHGSADCGLPSFPLKKSVII